MGPVQPASPWPTGSFIRGSLAGNKVLSLSGVCHFLLLCALIQALLSLGTWSKKIWLLTACLSLSSWSLGYINSSCKSCHCTGCGKSLPFLVYVPNSLLEGLSSFLLGKTWHWGWDHRLEPCSEVTSFLIWGKPRGMAARGPAVWWPG